jgi:putative DNA primase/helicase
MTDHEHDHGPHMTPAAGTAPGLDKPGASDKAKSGIPFMITESMKARLRQLGHDDAAISVMTPEAAHRILGNGHDQSSETDNPRLKAALNIAAQGMFVFPVTLGQKKSEKSKKYSGVRWGMTRDPAQIRRDFHQFPNANVGIATGSVSGFFILEADTVEGHGKDGIASLRALEAEHGTLPATRMAISPSGSIHYYYRNPEGVTIINSSDKLALGVDSRGENGIVLAPPSVRPAKGDKPEGVYRWLNKLPIADAPYWLIERLVKIKVEHIPSGSDPQDDPAKIAAAFEVIPNPDLGWDDWNNRAMALWRATGGSEQGLIILDRWSQKSIKYDPNEVFNSWNRITGCPPTEYTVASVYGWADEVSSDWREKYDQACDEEARLSGEFDDDDENDPDEIKTSSTGKRTRLIIVSDSDHMSRARRFQRIRRPHLVRYRADFMDFVGGAYRVFDDDAIKSETWRFLEKVKARRRVDRTKNAPLETVPFRPNRNSVGETLAALEAVAHLDPDLEVPCWLNGRSDLPPKELIAFPNGILDLRDNKLHPLDPNYFTIAALGFNYVAAAPTPHEWLTFLDQIFHSGNDPEQRKDKEDQIAMLQEVIGLLMTCDTSQEKAFLFLGPKRSGKGTILAMIRRLLASTSVIGPSLQSLATPFGLTPMIGKQLAIIDDLRVTPKDQNLLIENVLKITGRGFFTIDRKYKSAWSGSLLVKLILISNLMPRLGDDSAAIASRFITLITRQSFYGREDPRLFEDKLLPELLGIFHWALQGLQRLRERGYFIETDASKDARDRLGNLGSPARAFLAEHCVLGPDQRVSKDVLYDLWRDYSKDNTTLPGTIEAFSEKLYAAGNGLIGHGRPRDESGKQFNVYTGIRLQTDEELPPAKTLVRRIIREDDKAIYIDSLCTAGEVRLLKSEITMTKTNTEAYEILIPGWWVKRKKLENAQRDDEPDIPF